METSQGVKTVLIQQAEAGVRKLLESLQTIEEGDLKGLEQQVLETIFAVGRGWMESMLSEPAPEERAASQRMGSCGHAQQLEGYRPKQVLTRFGQGDLQAGLLPLYRGRRPSRESREGSRRGRCQPKACMYPWRSAGGCALGTARATDECGSSASRELSVCVLDAGRSC